MLHARTRTPRTRTPRTRTEMIWMWRGSIAGEAANFFVDVSSPATLQAAERWYSSVTRVCGTSIPMVLVRSAPQGSSPAQSLHCRSATLMVSFRLPPGGRQVRHHGGEAAGRGHELGAVCRVARDRVGRD